MKVYICVPVFFSILFYNINALAENPASTQYADVSGIEYLEEPEDIPDKARNSRSSDLSKKINQTSPSRLSSDDLVKVIDASIKTCNIYLAQHYIQQLKKLSDPEFNRFIKQINNNLKNKISMIERHKENLHNLAMVMQNGNVNSIKIEIRKSLKTISCPDDRNQLSSIVKNIQAVLRDEAKAKQRIMNNAINKGQAAQNEKIQQRRIIAKSILLLVGAIDFDDIDSSDISAIRSLQNSGGLTNYDAKNPKQLANLNYTSANSLNTTCRIDETINTFKDRKGKDYYITSSTSSHGKSKTIEYKIKVITKGADPGKKFLPGPYKNLSTAKMIVRSLCPVSQRAVN